MPQFPNESAEYREARRKLLEAEKALRAQIETVAAQRRALPVGGEVPEDYSFESAKGSVKLSQLFHADQTTLLLYSFMFSPKMETPCTGCTAVLDGFNGTAQHVRQRANLIVVAKSPIARISEFAKSRGWTDLRFVSSENNSYNRDYFGENEEGQQLPMLNVFVKRGDSVHHSWASELMSEPGLDLGGRKSEPRHVDLVWPLWNLLDLTPEGRGEETQPKLSY